MKLLLYGRWRPMGLRYIDDSTALRIGRSLAPEKFSRTKYCQRPSEPQSLVLLEGLRNFKKSVTYRESNTRPTD
jgi:hypothetical protein